MRGLSGKLALVTGGGGAIGRAICRRLAEDGAVVAACDKSAAAAEETARIVREDGGSAHAVAVDITDHAGVVDAVDRLEAAAGPIELLVNAAGWDRVANFLDTDPALWDAVIAVNLKGHLSVMHAVLGRMAERGRGRVVTISSDAARVGSSGEAVYAACKAGLVALSKTLARELAGRAITVNVVAPGPTDTPLYHSFLGEGEHGQKIHDALRRAIPMKRIGKPDDVTGVVAFLLSDEAAYITGQVVSVSGGLTMHG